MPRLTSLKMIGDFSANTGNHYSISPPPNLSVLSLTDLTPFPKYSLSTIAKAPKLRASFQNAKQTYN